MLKAFQRLREPQNKREAWRLVIFYTIIAVLASAVLTYFFAREQGWDVGASMVPAISIPCLVAPWMTWTVASYAIRLHELRIKFERLAHTDPLSGALNRRGLREFADRAFSAQPRQALSAIILDIDRFKTINDNFGHSAGDTVIAEAAQILRRIMGSDGCAIGRLGGDELAALFIGRSLEEATALAERLRDAVERASFFQEDTEDAELKVTVSIGVSAADPGDLDVEAMLKRADRSLYAAKSAGRNRVRAAA